MSTLIDKPTWTIAEIEMAQALAPNWRALLWQRWLVLTGRRDVKVGGGLPEC